MKILCIDVEGMGLDWCLRCIAAGHEVTLYRIDAAKTKDGKGFKGLKIVDDWRPQMGKHKEGLITITGNFRFLAELDRFRDLGFKIFGPTQKSAAFEIERSVGMAAMEQAGIALPPYETFDSLQAAERYARRSDKTLVFKCCGDETDKSLSYVSSDPADMCGWIRQKIERGLSIKGKCMLQDRIDLVCELGVSGWFGPEGFLPGKWQLCWEHKKLMGGEIGPNTGEMGTVTQYVETDKLANETLVPMVGALRKAGHCGDFAIGVGIDAAGKSHAMEFTARMGWPAFFLQTASHKGDPAQWMRDLLDGKDTLKVSQDACVGVVMGQPNFPYNKSPPELVEGNPIGGVDEVLEDVHFASVMLGKGPEMKSGKVVDGPIYRTTGEYVLVCTGLGKTVERARKAVYKTVDAVKFPNSIYRLDIGEKIEKTLPALHKHGYAEGVKYS